MSDRPTNISQWATTTNYGAGANPWNGQPTKVAPGSSEFTPGQPLPAEVLNYLRNEERAKTQALVDWTSMLPVSNWSRPYAPSETILEGSTDIDEVTAVCWSPKLGGWILACLETSNDAGADYVHLVAVRDDQWLAGGGQVGPVVSNGFTADSNTYTTLTCVTAVIAKQDDPDVVFYFIDTKLQKMVLSTGAVTTLSTLTNTKRAQLAYFNGYYIVVAGGTSTGQLLLRTSPDGTTWTNQSLHAVLTSNAGTTGENEIAVSSSRAIFAALYDNLHALGYSDDGTTWGLIILDSGMFTTSDKITALCAGKHATSGADAFFMSIKKSTGGCEVWRSYDQGDTWELAGALSSVIIHNMKAFGSLVVGVAIEDDGSEDNRRVIYSVDNGETWRFAPGGFSGGQPTTGGDPKDIRPQLAISPTGLCLYQNSNFRFSANAGLGQEVD